MTKKIDIENCKDIKEIERIGKAFEISAKKYHNNFERCLKRRSELATNHSKKKE